MEAQADDAAAETERLQQWGPEQARLHPPRVSLRARARHAGQWVHLQLVNRSERFANPVLDWGIDTTTHVALPEHEHPERKPYVPSAWHVLPRALRYVGVSDRDTFVDFGSGKGRVVHQAARQPFRKVIGVEISPVLAEIARATLAARSHQHRCREIEIVVADAAEYQVPDDLTVAYFFYPFSGGTFDLVLQHIVDSIDRHPRRVSLIYTLPLEATQVVATGRFRLVKELGGGLSGHHVQPVKIFESCPSSFSLRKRKGPLLD